MSNNEQYAIMDIQDYSTKLRELVVEEIGATDSSDINNYVTINQIIKIIDEHCSGYTENDEPVVTYDSHCDIFDDIVVMVQNFALAKLAAEDVLECAWDNELNDMIFWKKDHA